MPQQELLKQLVPVLVATGIDYMVTGSTASSIQGEPRSTHAIDLVVVMPPIAAHALARAFPPPDYYLSEDAVMEGIKQKTMISFEGRRIAAELQLVFEKAIMEAFKRIQ
jgi:hypothetical protein